MATIGPILRTLENTAPVEKGRILFGHKGPQCHNLDRDKWGQRAAFMALRLSFLEVAAP